MTWTSHKSLNEQRQTAQLPLTSLALNTWIFMCSQVIAANGLILVYVVQICHISFCHKALAVIWEANTQLDLCIYLFELWKYHQQAKEMQWVVFCLTDVQAIFVSEGKKKDDQAIKLHTTYIAMLLLRTSSKCCCALPPSVPASFMLMIRLNLNKAIVVLFYKYLTYWEVTITEKVTI